MPHLDIRSTGNGPKQSAMWLDGVPCTVEGFHEWPKVGKLHLIDGLLYRLVEISDRAEYLVSMWTVLETFTSPGPTGG